MDVNPKHEVVSHADPMHHVTSIGTYLFIFGTLMVLTFLTVWISGINLGPLNTSVALAIAICKATLVVLFFMHLRHSTRLTWVVLLGSIMWLGVLFVLTFADYATRPGTPSAKMLRVDDVQTTNAPMPAMPGGKE